jgi:hypothetical protein
MPTAPCYQKYQTSNPEDWQGRRQACLHDALSNISAGSCTLRVQVQGCCNLQGVLPLTCPAVIRRCHERYHPCLLQCAAQLCARRHKVAAVAVHVNVPHRQRVPAAVLQPHHFRKYRLIILGKPQVGWVLSSAG